MNRPELNIAQIVAMILDIESKIGVKCLSYGLYDKTRKEYITESNKNSCYEYYEAYEHKFMYRYTHDNSLMDNAVIYLLKHHGEIYFPMLKKGTQKAFVAQFDVIELLSKYGQNHSVTPDKYFTEKFCWNIKKTSKQCVGQLVLPLAEMEVTV